MDVKQINLYLEQYNEYFPADQMINLRKALVSVPDKYLEQITATKLINPTYTQVASVVGGAVGVDRFLIGDKALGFVKMFTLGGLGIWAVVDMFLVQGNTKKKNYDKLMKCIVSISDPAVHPQPAPMPFVPTPVAYSAPVAPMAAPAPVAPRYAAPVVPVTPVAPTPKAAPVAKPVEPAKPAEPVKPAVPTMAPTPPKK